MKMMVLAYTLMVIGALGMIASVWGLVCNNRTYDQRVDMVSSIYEQENYKYYEAMYNEVDYEQHMYRLFFFRNPYKLYDSKLQVLVGQGVEA
jgi:hypothetical protein